MAASSFGAYSELIFHIGLHKTGTSYLQSLMRHNAGVLREAGIHYPEYRGKAQAEAADGNHSLAMLGTRAGEPLARGLALDLMIPSQAPTLLLSAEGFCRRESIVQLASDKELLARARKPRLIVYVRRYDEISESTYAQEVKVRLSEPYRGPYYNVTDGLLRRLTPLITAFGKEALVLRPYNARTWPQGSLAADFCLALGRPDLRDKLMERPGGAKNVTRSRAQTWLLAQVKDRRAKAALVAHMAAHPLPVPTEPSRFFQSPAERKALNQAGLARDRALFAELGIADPVAFLGLDHYADEENWTPFVPDRDVLEPYLADFFALHPRSVTVEIGRIVRNIPSLPARLHRFARNRLRMF